MRRVCLAVLVSVVLAAPAAAQSNVEVNAGVQFDFLSPGARSLAMGGAFIGNADDATATFVNPAGLRAISRKEVSIEVRTRGFSIPVIVRGHQGLPTNQGIDTIAGLQEEDQDQDAAGLSFVSFVLPRPRWAIAAYIRALQLSQYARQNELQPDDLKRLDSQLISRVGQALPDRDSTVGSSQAEPDLLER